MCSELHSVWGIHTQVVRSSEIVRFSLIRCSNFLLIYSFCYQTPVQAHLRVSTKKKQEKNVVLTIIISMPSTRRQKIRARRSEKNWCWGGGGQKRA